MNTAVVMTFTLRHMLASLLYEAYVVYESSGILQDLARVH